MKNDIEKIKHSDGPWIVGPEGDTIHEPRYGLVIARVVLPSPGAWSSDVAQRMEANARLLAGAEELFRAARAIRAYLAATEQYIINPTGGQLGRACALLEDAIAKAEGTAE